MPRRIEISLFIPAHPRAFPPSRFAVWTIKFPVDEKLSALMEATRTTSWSSSMRVFSHLFYLLSKHTHIYRWTTMGCSLSWYAINRRSRRYWFEGKTGEGEERVRAERNSRLCCRGSSYLFATSFLFLSSFLSRYRRDKSDTEEGESAFSSAEKLDISVSVSRLRSLRENRLLRSSIWHKFKWVPSRRVRSCILIHGSVHMHSNRARSVHMHRSSAHEYTGILRSLNRASFAVHAINVFSRNYCLCINASEARY